jgi:hypothetical protein
MPAGRQAALKLQDSRMAFELGNLGAGPHIPQPDRLVAKRPMQRGRNLLRLQIGGTDLVVRRA